MLPRLVKGTSMIWFVNVNDLKDDVFLERVVHWYGCWAGWTHRPMICHVVFLRGWKVGAWKCRLARSTGRTSLGRVVSKGQEKRNHMKYTSGIFLNFSRLVLTRCFALMTHDIIWTPRLLVMLLLNALSRQAFATRIFYCFFLFLSKTGI